MLDRTARKASFIMAAAGAFALCSTATAFGQAWAFSGGDASNARNAASESKITVKNAGSLTKKWEFATNGDVSATPTVEVDEAGKTHVYIVDWAGYLYSIDGLTGTPFWSQNLQSSTGNTVGTASRTSPAIVGPNVVVGDQGDLNLGGTIQNGGTTASVMSFNKKTGTLNWRTVVSDHPWSIVTSSPVAYNGVIYVGVASFEEGAKFLGPYIFSFRGKVLALDAKTGSILWSLYTISDTAYTQGYTGASVWGSTPVVDAKRGSLYVGTGNNYSSPAGIGNPSGPAAPADDHFDSVLALDLKTGAIRWATRVLAADTWDAFRQFVFDPDPADRGPDYDFGSGPNLFTITGGKQLLGAGQKSGIYWALNPDTGQVVWSTQVGPGGTGGGIEWGSAVDGKRVYSAISNTDGHPYTLLVPSTGSATSTNGGLVAGMDAITGALKWQTVDPFGGHNVGAITIANGVLFAGSAGNPPFAPFNYPGTPGGMFALNGTTGGLLWSFPINGAVNSGPSVVNGTVYWGSGYSHLGNAFGISGGSKLYAFSLK